MKSDFRGGRVVPDRRRRAARRSPWTVEPLESRRLLAAGAFGLNVVVDPTSSFVNMLQIPGRWDDYSATDETPTIAFNASGDPSHDASLVIDYRVNQIFNGPDPAAVPPDLSGTYHLSFQGQATLGSTFPEPVASFTIQHQAYDPSTNTTTADIVVPAGNTEDLFIISLHDTRATAGSAVDTGFSNARLIRPGYAADSTQLYTNEFLSALRPYSALRYMEPNNANNQPFFHNNTLVTVGASKVDQTGVPWEYLIALANQTHTDMWINIPQGATDGYVAALAGIFKDGGTVNGVAYPGLDSGLKVYLEYSNEVWGGIPFNLYYQGAAVQDVADNHPLSTFSSNLHVYDNSDGSTSTDAYQAVGRRYLERTADIGRIFQGVLGSDPTHQRIRPVLGWQENSPGFYPAALGWYEHFFGLARDAFYGLGDANYFNATDYSSVDAAIASLAASEASYAVPDTTAYSTLAAYYGLANVSYEGGPGVPGDGTAAGVQVGLAASRDPRMEPIVLKHYQNFYAAGGSLAMYFDGPFNTWTPGNAWGVAEMAQYGHPTASAKYRGTVDVAAAASVAPTAGVVVAPSGPTSFAASIDSLGAGFSSPSPGQQGYWLLNVASPGTYDLSLATGGSADALPSPIAVFLNDRPVGSTLSVPSGSSIDLGRLVLSRGLNTLSIRVIGTTGGAVTPAAFLPSTLTLASIPPLVADPGFESASTWPIGYAYNPLGSAWAFTGYAGVTANASGFTAGNPNAPQGAQAAFLQETGSFSQTVDGWAAGSYALSFQAARRGNYGTQLEDFQILVDGLVVGTFQPNSSSYQPYATPSFTVAAGSHTIKFLGLNSVGGDNTAFIDALSIATAPAPSGLPDLGDSGFESLFVGPIGYAYDPLGSAWAFTSYAGVTANASGFTAGNPNAPQGAQAAFLQETGSFSQTVDGWAAGSYALSFQAARRGNYGTQLEDFQILVDGLVVGTFQPNSSGYQAYRTARFTVSAGRHTIRFVGLNTAGGDNTAFIDAVTIATA